MRVIQHRNEDRARLFALPGLGGGLASIKCEFLQAVRCLPAKEKPVNKGHVFASFVSSILLALGAGEVTKANECSRV